MKRVLKVVAVVVLVVVVLLILGALFLDQAVKRAAVAVLPAITGTPVELSDVSISLFSGKGSIRGLVIRNPEGFKTDSAFSLGEARVALDIRSLFSDTVVIKEIYVDAPKVTYEAALGGSNISKIKENIDKLSKEEQEKSPAEKEKAPGKKVIIKHFLMENGKIAVSAKMLAGQAMTVPMPTVELRDIGTASGGKTPAEIASEIFAPVTSGIEGAVEKVIGMGKEVLQKGAEAVSEEGKKAVDTGKEAIKDAADKVKDIFR